MSPEPENGPNFRYLQVVKAIKRGDAYVFCTASTITKKKRQAIQDAIDALYAKYGQAPKARVYTADRIAAWAQQHLGLAADHLNVAIDERERRRRLAEAWAGRD